MLGWLFVLALVVAVWLAFAVVDLRYRAHWQRLSWEARVRRAEDRAATFLAALGKLRSDRESGRLVINDDYAMLFERLTAETRRGE